MSYHLVCDCGHLLGDHHLDGTCAFCKCREKVGPHRSKCRCGHSRASHTHTYIPSYSDDCIIRFWTFGRCAASGCYCGAFTKEEA